MRDIERVAYFQTVHPWELVIEHQFIRSPFMAQNRASFGHLVRTGHSFRVWEDHLHRVQIFAIFIRVIIIIKKYPKSKIPTGPKVPTETWIWCCDWHRNPATLPGRNGQFIQCINWGIIFRSAPKVLFVHFQWWYNYFGATVNVACHCIGFGASPMDGQFVGVDVVQDLCAPVGTWTTTA